MDVCNRGREGREREWGGRNRGGKGSLNGICYTRGTSFNIKLIQRRSGSRTEYSVISTSAKGSMQSRHERAAVTCNGWEWIKQNTPCLPFQLLLCYNLILFLSGLLLVSLHSHLRLLPANYFVKPARLPWLHAACPLPNICCAPL